MSDETVIAPAPAGDMSETDALAVFEALAAAKHDPASDPAPVVTPENDDDDETPAAPAADATSAPTPAPAAPAPAPAATDIWSSASPEIRAAHAAEIERERQRYNSDIGRQSAYQRQIEALKAEIAAAKAPPAAPAPASAAPTPATTLRENPVIKKSLEEYSEVGLAPVLDEIDSVKAENARMGRVLSSIEEDRRTAQIARNEQALTARHPDWAAVCATPDFEDWFHDQPDEMQAIVKRNGQQIVNAKDAIAMVDAFKGHLALKNPPQAPQPVAAPAPAAPTNLAERRAAQLAAVTTAPKGGLTAIPDGAPLGEAASVFDHFVKRKASKGK